MDELYHDNGKETFLVHYRKGPSYQMTTSHFHTTYEFFYMMDGQRKFFIKDRTLIIEGGDIVVVAPNVLHRTTSAETPEYERLVVNVHESYLPEGGGSRSEVLRPLYERDYVLLRRGAYESSGVDALAGEMIREVRSGKPGFEAYAQALTTQLLIACCRLLPEEEEQPPAHNPMHERIFEVVRYINGHYAEELTLQKLGGKLYVSPYSISRSFKEATGFTFVEYVNSVRVKEAITLLLGTTLKVNVIARKVGFGSVTHFGRVFREVTGHAPLFYRKESQVREEVSADTRRSAAKRVK
ncbi:AraC family transcriptional regulator [Saccharibacillus alkalitolerans]|uniref:AraC family transcriptional regulator n=1 Tax=Saccharibacillus alkalitolerans TaxID=2705290 RepID=A0ABX0FAY1_9BACL|nr:AraC family transcriptional regulator [Saccharibacillus alkalitolerans]NGZ77209.1 AraC family transcriptional regulator [Saccharibacillus alkalitolerans]